MGGDGSLGRGLRRDRGLVMELWGVWIGRRGRRLGGRCRVRRTFEGWLCGGYSSSLESKAREI